MDKTKSRNETLIGILVVVLVFLFILYLLFSGFFRGSVNALYSYDCLAARGFSCVLTAYNNSEISFSIMSTNESIRYNTQLACSNETTYSSIPSNVFRSVPQLGSMLGQTIDVTSLPCVGNPIVTGNSQTAALVYLWVRYTAINESENSVTNPWLSALIARVDFNV